MAADVDIEREKLRIAATADRVSPVLNKWGVARANCAPGLVFISGLGSDTVCIQPSPSMGAGAYTYDNAKQQLVRSGGTTSTASNSSGTATTNSSVTSEKNDGETIHKVQSTKVSKDGQSSVKTVQSTKVSSPSSDDEGF